MRRNGVEAGSRPTKRFEAGVAALVLFSAVGIVELLKDVEQDKQDQVRNLTKQARQDVAGFISLNKDDIAHRENHVGDAPMRITFRLQNGLVATCTATIAENSYIDHGLPEAHGGADSLAIEHLNNCPPAQP